ncbi:uncharacterized protein [Anas platyrhynchos]|uniref:uncharacterized protein n=1 Tax=Anas platyrhynchos TaxID=8839 RepID=UPI003AF2C564
MGPGRCDSGRMIVLLRVLSSSQSLPLPPREGQHEVSREEKGNNRAESAESTHVYLFSDRWWKVGLAAPCVFLLPFCTTRAVSRQTGQHQHETGPQQQRACIFPAPVSAEESPSRASLTFACSECQKPLELRVTLTSSAWPGSRLLQTEGGEAR